MNIDLRIACDWQPGKYPRFTCALANGAREPFLEIKGCRIVSGKNGDFVSWPAYKNESTGKWYPHIYSVDAFGALVLEAALKTRPAKEPEPEPDPRPARAPAKDAGGFADMDDDIPFS